MYRRDVAFMVYLSNLAYVTIQTYDGTVFEGDVVRVEDNYCVIDDVSAFRDMVIIHYSDIIGISGR